MKYRKLRAAFAAFFAALCACAVAALGLYSLLPGDMGFRRSVADRPYDDDAYFYSGTLLSGKFDGRGEVNYANGDRYEGGFADGRFHGDGVFRSKDGWRFEGNFSLGAPVDGVFYTPDGARLADTAQPLYSSETWSYRGALGAQGQRGEGRFAHSDGRAYEGRFDGGLANGRGMYTADGAVIYDGEWLDGLYEGEGVYKAPDGSFTYAGEFKAGKFDGQGTVTQADGTVLRGTWRQGWRVAK